MTDHEIMARLTARTTLQLEKRDAEIARLKTLYTEMVAALVREREMFQEKLAEYRDAEAVWCNSDYLGARWWSYTKPLGADCSRRYLLDPHPPKEGE